MNKKIIIIGMIFLVVISLIIVMNFVNKTNESTDIENEVVTIINNLNSSNGYYGDWNSDLHIVRVNEVKKIDINLLNEEDKEFIDENTSAFMMDLEEETYGNIQIVVVDGEVTANSILGETYDEMWNSNIFIKDTLNIEKINKEIK